MIVENTTLSCLSNAEGATRSVLRKNMPRRRRSFVLWASFFYKHVTPSGLKNRELRNI